LLLRIKKGGLHKVAHSVATAKLELPVDATHDEANGKHARDLLVARKCNTAVQAADLAHALAARLRILQCAPALYNNTALALHHCRFAANFFHHDAAALALLVMPAALRELEIAAVDRAAVRVEDEKLAKRSLADLA